MTTFRSRPAMLALAVAGTLALTVLFFSPVRQAVTPTLDLSNYASFAYFTAHGFQFGTDVMHVGGPYGFVHYGFIYGGNLFAKRFPLELLTKLALAALVVGWLRRRPGWLRWIWLAAVVFAVPLVEDLSYDFAILLAGLRLLECQAEWSRRTRIIGCALSGFLALLTLIKGTHAMLSLATFALIALQAAATRNWRPLPWLAGAYAATLLVLLLAAGQDPLGFPSYLRSIIEQSAGYNNAMVLEEPWAAFGAGVGALVALELAAVAVALPRRDDAATVAGALFLAGFSFIEWKHGFVRADGHVYIFFAYAIAAAPTLLLLPRRAAPPPPGWRHTAAGAAAAAALFGFWGDGLQSLARQGWVLRELPLHFAESFRQITRPAATKARFDAELGRNRKTYALPEIRERVGDEPVDFFGNGHAYLVLNRLNYRPRPAGGGNFSVFNAWLQDANLRHLDKTETRPRYFLAEMLQFDNRFTAQDDSTTLRALLALYEPVDAEQGMVLFQLRDDTSAVPPGRPMESREISFGEMITVPATQPGEMLAVEFDLPMNAVGWIRRLFYKPPLVYGTFEGTGIENPDSRRIVPTMCTRPVILDPVLENTRDLVAVFQDDALPAKHVRRFSLQTTHPECFDGSELKVRFLTVPRPRRAKAAAHIATALEFPEANRTPESLQPPNAPRRIFDGLPVQMLEPPGRITFGLNDGDNELDFAFGMDPEAYTKGRSDGVEFVAELARPGAPSQVVFSRWIRPRLQPADAGTHTARVFLPPFPPGSKLVLRTTPGSDGDAAWDWGYCSGIRIGGNGYRLEQFPGFAAVPSHVEAAMCGAMPYEGRDIFMLNAPGTLEFTLAGGERQLTVSGGILPGAYSAGGNSDGAEFLVELKMPDGARRELFRRLLDPRTHPGDRGSQVFTVDLPRDVPPGSSIRVRTGPGPSGSNAWDWTYIDGLRFD